MNLSGGALILVAALTASLAACSSSPTATSVKPENQVGVRTGAVRNIAIKDAVTPAALTVHAGDEVRWINQRQRPVRVTFQEPLDHVISCQRGFTKIMGMGTDNAADIAPNESAGLCFTRLGTKQYTVTTDPDDPARTTPVTGVIRVE